MKIMSLLSQSIINSAGGYSCAYLFHCCARRYMSKCKPHLVYLVKWLGLHRADVDRMASILRCSTTSHYTMLVYNSMRKQKPYVHNGRRQSGVPPAPQTGPAANGLAYLTAKDMESVHFAFTQNNPLAAKCACANIVMLTRLVPGRPQ